MSPNKLWSQRTWVCLFQFCSLELHEVRFHRNFYLDLRLEMMSQSGKLQTSSFGRRIVGGGTGLFLIWLYLCLGQVCVELICNGCNGMTFGLWRC